MLIRSRLFLSCSRMMARRVFQWIFFGRLFFIGFFGLLAALLDKFFELAFRDPDGGMILPENGPLPEPAGDRLDVDPEQLSHFLVGVKPLVKLQRGSRLADRFADLRVFRLRQCRRDL